MVGEQMTWRVPRGSNLVAVELYSGSPGPPGGPPTIRSKRGQTHVSLITGKSVIRNVLTEAVHDAPA